MQNLPKPAAIAPIVNISCVADVDFQACRYGSRRPKWTRFRCSSSCLMPLAGPCPGESNSHVHEPYGAKRVDGAWTFATSEEAEYTVSLCDAIVKELLPTDGRRLILFELCCGSARLSSRCSHAGGTSYPYDCAANRHSPTVPFQVCDLSQPEAVASVLSKLWSAVADITNRVVVVWAVPCGTRSRARERPISASLRAKGCPEPKPLRF